MSTKECYKVVFEPSNRYGYVEKYKTLKDAAAELEINIEGSCVQLANCGKCLVIIDEQYRHKLTPLSAIENKFFSQSQKKKGYRLACQARILGNTVAFIPLESRAVNQIVRKATTKKPTALKPAVHIYHVKLTQAAWDNPIGDWDHLKQVLEEEFGLRNLIIDYQVLLTLQDTLRGEEANISVFVWKNKEVIRIIPGISQNAYGLAVDVGTTTVAGYLCNLVNGEIIATACAINPQIKYGEDIMSRIGYAINKTGGLDNLSGSIINCLNSIAGDAAGQAGIKLEQIVDMTIVGNTCMHHLFLNLKPDYIGRAPFSSAISRSIDIKAREFGCRIDNEGTPQKFKTRGRGVFISPGAYIHVLPIEAGFVGSDNVAVLIAEEPYKQDEIMLVIDIGTNGELVIGNNKRLLSSSCATGPAFEGARMKHGMRAAPGAIERITINPSTIEVRFKVINRDAWNDEVENIGAKGICGSAIIDIVPQLFLAGIIDRTGCFKRTLSTPRLRKAGNSKEFVIAWARETAIGHDITICQKDIRAIQLAKAAVYAGTKVMMRTLGTKNLNSVIMAGAFGSYIDKKSAAVLGLFPNIQLKNIYSVGNAAGEGAIMALLNLGKRREADEIARKVEYIELALVKDFQQEFTQALWIPHMTDEFPAIEHLLLNRSAL